MEDRNSEENGVHVGEEQIMMNGNASPDVMDEGVDLGEDEADELIDGFEDAEEFEVDLEEGKSLDGLLSNIVTNSLREKQDQFRANLANLRAEVDQDTEKLENAEAEINQLMAELVSLTRNKEEEEELQPQPQIQPQVPSPSEAEVPSSSQTEAAPVTAVRVENTGVSVSVEAQKKRRKRRRTNIKQPQSFTPPPSKRGPDCADQAPFDHIIRGKPRLADHFWAMKGSSLVEPWELSSLLSYSCEEQMKEERGKPSVKLVSHKFKVKFADGLIKELTGKQVAQAAVSSVRLIVGTRVIAVYQEEGSEEPGLFYPGVVGDTPSGKNGNRYLVFFDDTYPQYVSQHNLRLVYQHDQDVWNDVWRDGEDGNDLTEFLPSFLRQFPRRPMVKLQEGDKIRVATVKKKKKEIWVEAEINWVDCLLAQISFDDPRIGQKMCELIYRGSPRLEPVKKNLADLAKQSSSQERRVKPRQNQVQPVRITMMEPQEFEGHDCGSACEEHYEYHADRHRGSNPLRIPLHLGWRRKYAVFDDKEQGEVSYFAPCGRKLRNIEEVQAFLKHIKSKLEIDFFAFDPWLDVMREFIPEPDFIQVMDISFGQERIPVPAANSYDSHHPNLIQYSTVPVPQSNVHIETDPGFLVRCDCVGICDEKLEGKIVCPCRQLTISSQLDKEKYSEAGYRHR